ncbi:hypothetical protein PLEOSDRAFT_161311 [Pleurotus ostreatus PC15]|uniref:Uncharacterized protein n=1 Tax=Pleurotus ostreatus (strain PC15) TaxID=1137138 RepID=A0A067N9X2_PLEO1|nr:hypothetical protein PLEOSDRAFT_161311 [Pleurotus ostreatus PC15]
MPLAKITLESQLALLEAAFSEGEPGRRRSSAAEHLATATTQQDASCLTHFSQQSPSSRISMQFAAAILATAAALATLSSAAPAPTPLEARAEATPASPNAPAKDDLLYGYRYRYGPNRWRFPSVSVPVVRPVEVAVTSEVGVPGAETIVAGVV